MIERRINAPQALAVAVALMVAGSPIHAQTGSLSGRITAPGPVPFVGAQVTLDDSISAVADDSGRYRFPAVAKGAHTVVVRHIGFAPLMNFFHVDPRENVRRDFALKPIATELAAVTVVGERGEVIPRKLVDFERRRSFGIGRFLGPADLAKHENERTSSVLRFFPGVVIRRGSGSAAFPVNTRGPGGVRSQGAAGCPVTVYVDGAMSSDPYFNVDALQVSQLSAIEYFAGPATTPAQYAPRGLSCGVMLIWTK